MTCQQCNTKPADCDFYTKAHRIAGDRVFAEVQVSCPNCGAEYVADKFGQTGEIESWYLARKGEEQ